jgi:hypothetical protein
MMICASTAPASERHARPFELTMEVKRDNVAKTQHSGGSRAVKWESDMTLFGTVELERGGAEVVFYADSIRYESREPRAFQTFMSADTMYYRIPSGGGAIDHHRVEYDSMLACVFGGAALRVLRDEGGVPPQTQHLNARCPSGEYGRINAPVTLGAFVIAAPGERSRWLEHRPAPSFSGLGFHPRIKWFYRAVAATEDEVTVTVAADSTIENFTTCLQSGEEVTIVRDRIRLGGTMVIDRATGLPTHAELRIGESSQMVRPHAAGMVITRDGHYTIRFTLP